MGEMQRRLALRKAEAETTMTVDTPGGRIQVQWDREANATPYGQLAFFAEFLQVSGIFDTWVAGCPLSDSSPNAPSIRDVLGTWMLSVLAEHRRYAHVTGLPGDGVSPHVLGLSRLISEDALRRALSTEWTRRGRRLDARESHE